jgi:hypothetical protein
VGTGRCAGLFLESESEGRRCSMITGEVHDVEGDHVRKLLRVCLERAEAMPRKDLVSYLGMEEGVIDRELGRLVECGEVEILRPVRSEDEPDSVPCRREHEFYRMVRNTDRTYLWEYEIRARYDRKNSVGLERPKIRRSEVLDDLDANVLGLVSSLAMS